MAHLPPEVLSIIFDHLERKDRLQCCLVCHAWSPMALYRLYNFIHLKHPIDMLMLFEKLYQPGSIEGDSVQYLSFPNGPVEQHEEENRSIFINILKYCKNIKVLDFSSAPSEWYISSIARYKDSLRLDSLQCIKGFQNLGTESYILAHWHFSRSITRLDLRVGKSSFQQIPEVVDIYSYLKQFPTLKTLLIKPYCTVCLHDLLCVSPQLEVLKIFGLSADLNLYNGESTHQHESTTFQIKYLRLEARDVNQELFEYLHGKAYQLSRLEIGGSTFDETGIEPDAFNTLLDAELPVRYIGFGDGFTVHHEMFVGLNRNFQALTRVKLQNCDFRSVMDENSNLTLDFNALNLQYLALNFSNVMSDKKSISVTSLVIDRNETDTIHYQRTSKWNPRQLFIKKESPKYMDKVRLNRRLISSHCSVITIQVRGLAILRMSLYGGFNQLIQL